MHHSSAIGVRMGQVMWDVVQMRSYCGYDHQFHDKAFQRSSIYVSR